MMKTELTALCTINGLISCEPGSCRRICNGSYTSGDLKKNDTLISAKGGTSSKIGPAGRSIRVSKESFSTFIDCGEISSCCDTYSATISGPGPGSDLSSTSCFGSELSSTFGSDSGLSTAFTTLLSNIFTMLARISLHSAIRSLNCGPSRCEAYRV